MAAETGAAVRKVIMVEMDSVALAAVLRVAVSHHPIRQSVPPLVCEVCNGIMELREEFLRHGIHPESHI